MSHFLKITDDTFASWFSNSWLALDELRFLRGKGSPYTLYENEYGVKIHRHGILGLAESVEFPSEAEATMFLLRWS